MQSNSINKTVPLFKRCLCGTQVKNSLRAVNDRFDDADFEPPPVRVVVAEGDEDVTIKVEPFRQ